VAARRTLVPGGKLLKEAHTDDTHGPLEVLRPRGDNGRKRHSAHAEEGLGLEVAEKRHGVGGDVSGGIGVPEPRGDGRYNQTHAGNDGGHPCHGFLLDAVAVGQLGLNTGKRLLCVLVGDSDANDGVQIGNGVGNACSC